MTLVQSLARFACNLRWSDIPQEQQDAIRLHLLDTLGCILFARHLPLGKIAIDLLTSDDQAHSILGTRRRASASDAALLNGILAAAFELDAAGAYVHPGPCIIPAAFVAAERTSQALGRSVPGDEFLAAIFAGYEITVRVSDWVGFTPERLAGWHTPAFHGAIGAAASAALLLGASADGVSNAIALATDMAGGGLIHARNDSKRVHTGRAAQTGVLAALLAAAGTEGTQDILEDSRWGYRRALCIGDDIDSGKVGDDSGPLPGTAFRFEALQRLAFKYYPFHSAAQTIIDNVVDLRRATGISSADVKSVKVGLSTYMYEHASMLKPALSLASVNFSLPYAVALSLVKDVPRVTAPQVDMRMFLESYLEEDIRELQRRVSFYPAQQLDRENEYTMDTFVDVLTFDGRELRQRSGYGIRAKAEKGASAIAFDDVTRVNVEEKFRNLSSMGAGTHDSANRVIGLIEELPRADVGSFVRALTTEF